MLENNENNESVYKDDMVGLQYPDISFDKIRENIKKKRELTKVLVKFMDQLQTKLIYLEKEINVTKLSSFYTSRILYLKKKKVAYDDSNIQDLHTLINFLVIHESTQLKGIASDKYLACKYVKMKLGENLCLQRIKVFNNFEQINFEELVKSQENYVLKLSNGCGDSVFIDDKTKGNITFIKEKIKYFYGREFGLTIVPEFFHLYSKKRIILEKKFEPFNDLFEFAFFVVNRNIRFIVLKIPLEDKVVLNFYDINFNIILDLSAVRSFDIFKKFQKGDLNKLKEYAYKLSEDFKNFIRVDLYLFHEKIYLSELTFDSGNGIPFYKDHKIFKDAGKEWKRVE